MGFGVWGLGFRVQDETFAFFIYSLGLGFGVCGLGFRVQDETFAFFIYSIKGKHLILFNPGPQMLSTQP